MNQGFEDLRVYKLSYNLAMEIFVLTKTFPKEEIYSLTDQIRRSSRAVCGCIAEGYRKRIYPKYFTAKMVDADGECAETINWLNFSTDCGYISRETKAKMSNEYAEVGRMLGSMISNPQKFYPKNLKDNSIQTLDQI